jgi:hypothetical protein
VAGRWVAAVTVSLEDQRLAHLAAEERAREAAVPSPSPATRPESHTEAMAAAHQGRPVSHHTMEIAP